LEANSLVCSLREFGEGQENGNGSMGRGELGRLHSWRLRACIICGDHTCLEEGGTQLAGSINTWRNSDMIVSVERQHTQEQISLVEFLHWVKEEGGCFTSVDKATKGEGALSLGAYLIGSFGKAQ
jgi:hypothetical protein